MKRTRRRDISGAVAVLTLLFATAAHAQSVPPAAPDVAPCASTQLSLGTDDENGNFNGMNHGGTLLVVRNISRSACSLDPFVNIVMRDAHGNALGIELDNTPGFPHAIVHGRPLQMGHGPVMFPLHLAAGAEATATLRWTNGAVFDHSTCVEATTLDVTIGAGTARTAAHARLCGADAQHLEVTASRFAPDPR